MEMNKLVRAYTKMRDARSQLRKEYEAQDTALKDKQRMIEAEMLRFLNENKIDSSKTEAGTFYRQVEIQPSGADWEAFYSWVAKNEAFDALERRVKKTFVVDYMEENDGSPPPGISVSKSYVIRVRRN